MINIKKVNLAYMDRDSLLQIAKDSYDEFKQLKDLPTSQTVVERITLKTISKHLQRYSFEDMNVNSLKNDIEDILMSDYERSLIERNKSINKMKSFSEINKHNMTNANIYPNKYNKR
ncbi:Uncharacterised protein [[Clostridium] sordellii]|uniref:hypothetical protein n=1 Tax=Paraclostridium sordellii TaxID=1505 RepID=UPI0005E00319|nr:hypothetical protein [Paeniclostridium sordellii]CEP40973.1 Uncharacterised protein [[Clostridium] sordellii] [Paeniclostridium sordellii]